MAKRGQLILFPLILTGAFAIAGRASAQTCTSSTCSDVMIVNQGTATIYNQAMPEGAAPNSETSLVFQQAPPIAPTSNYVILLEPSNEPPDPTETPVNWPGVGQVSDVIVGDFQSAPAAGPGVEFISDGDPQLQQIVNQIQAGAFPNVTFLTETGALQDVSGPLGSSTFGLQVLVQSDVVPEPSTLLLLAGGLAGIAASSRRLRS